MLAMFLTIYTKKIKGCPCVQNAAVALVKFVSLMVRYFSDVANK